MLTATDALDDPITRWSALILAVGGVVLGVLYAIVKLRKLAVDLGIVKREVKNDHSANLREEADERHDQNYRTLARIEQKVDAMAVEVGVHAFRLDTIDDDLGRTRDRRPER
jgi:hypothetical protein